MDAERTAYEEVYLYTMGRPGFILQHVVDAYAVQTATNDTKPIAIVFGLVGLYLRVEKQYSGRQVQLVHMELGRKKRDLPAIAIPENRGAITVADVRATPEGPARDKAIDDWCRAVWSVFAGSNRQTIIGLLSEY